MADRKAYTRQSEELRREALLDAALSLVAEGGFQAASVRAVAERAGVTAGLIRHYFGSKETLMQEAYQRLMWEMTAQSVAAADGVPGTPLDKIAASVRGSLTPPVMVADQVGLWAGFIHEVKNSPEAREIHRQTYLGFRDRLETLITALDRPSSPEADRRDAVACTAVIDGLWLEGALLPDAFARGEIVEIGLASVEAILGVRLPRNPSSQD